MVCNAFASNCKCKSRAMLLGKICCWSSLKHLNLPWRWKLDYLMTTTGFLGFHALVIVFIRKLLAWNWEFIFNHMHCSTLTITTTAGHPWGFIFITKFLNLTTYSHKHWFSIERIKRGWKIFSTFSTLRYAWDRLYYLCLYENSISFLCITIMHEILKVNIRIVVK